MVAKAEAVAAVKEVAGFIQTAELAFLDRIQLGEELEIDNLAKFNEPCVIFEAFRSVKFAPSPKKP